MQTSHWRFHTWLGLPLLLTAADAHCCSLPLLLLLCVGRQHCACEDEAASVVHVHGGVGAQGQHL